MKRLSLFRDGLELQADLDCAVSIAIPMTFDGAQPNHFGAPPARAETLRYDSGFVGDVREGGSCNVSVLAINPHCNGTHTECIGHITYDRVTLPEVIADGPWVATLISVTPLAPAGTNDAVDPETVPADRVITREALIAALDRSDPEGLAEAVVIRTLPNDESKRTRRYTAEAPPPYFSVDAIALLVEREVVHLVTDLPSVDRKYDGGRLLGHRSFWGLAAGADRSEQATRAHCSITELAFVPDALVDGRYALDLHLPALLSDALPSRPLLSPLEIVR